MALNEHFFFFFISDPSGKKQPYGIVKSIDSGQTAQSAQSDHSRNFSLSTDFLCIK